jgi:muramoyltetrapeptide carboxypeptidase
VRADRRSRTGAYRKRGRAAHGNLGRETSAAPNQVSHPRIKPRALKSGDTVGVVSPSAAIDREYLERGVAALKTMGFRVKVSRHALDREAIMAGPDDVRARELQAFFADPEVDAIFAARGGYGAGRILPLLDFEAIAHTPKVFMGFSDATFILNALVARAGMVCFHGPMVAMDFAHGLGRASLDHLRRLLAGEAVGFELPARAALKAGVAEGEVVGGCLSMVASAIGTPYAPPFDGAILFLEDTGEKAYRIDRMLVQLGQAGVFARVAAVVFGALRPPDGSEAEHRLIGECVAEQAARLDCPVLSGIEAGHGSANFTIPLGVRARVDAAARRITFLEPAVAV